MKKKKIFIFFAICLAASLQFTGFINFIHADAETKPKTSSEYKLFDTEESYEMELYQQMGRVYTSLKGHIQEENIVQELKFQK